METDIFNHALCFELIYKYEASDDYCIQKKKNIEILPFTGCHKRSDVNLPQIMQNWYGCINYINLKMILPEMPEWLRQLRQYHFQIDIIYAPISGSGIAGVGDKIGQDVLQCNPLKQWKIDSCHKSDRLSLCVLHKIHNDTTTTAVSVWK